MRERDLFLPSGYVSMRAVFELPFTFIWIVGGRGTGKTYGALEYLLEENIRFMLLRRTASQAQIVQNPAMSPIKSVVSDRNWQYTVTPVVKGIGGVYEYESVDGKDELIYPAAGYIASLSTFANVRGFDASDIDAIFYDEFIKEEHEKGMKGEADALLNAYETMNRNRELQGRKPIKMVAASNSTDLANPYFVRLGLVTEFERMRTKGMMIRELPGRDTCIIDLRHSPISDQKRNTALYRMARDTEFASMALDNDFGIDMSMYKSRSLKEYNPMIAVGELTIYRHKSRQEFYVSPHKSGNPPYYGTSKQELTRFRLHNRWLVSAYIRQQISFESYFCETLLCQYLKY